MNKGVKVGGGGGHTKGDEGVRRGRGAWRRERPFPNHLDLLFQEWGWRGREVEGRGDREGGVTPLVSLVSPKAVTWLNLPPKEVILESWMRASTTQCTQTWHFLINWFLNAYMKYEFNIFIWLLSWLLYESSEHDIWNAATVCPRYMAYGNKLCNPINECVREQKQGSQLETCTVKTVYKKK